MHPNYRGSQVHPNDRFSRSRMHPNGQGSRMQPGRGQEECDGAFAAAAQRLTCGAKLYEFIHLLHILVYKFMFLIAMFPFVLRTDRAQISSAALSSSVVTSDPGTPPTLTIDLKSDVEG